MPDNRFWNVKIEWKPAGFSWAECGAHIGYEHAQTAMDAIRLCAEWRDAPPPTEWRAVTVSLQDADEY